MIRALRHERVNNLRNPIGFCAIRHSEQNTNESRSTKPYAH